MYGSPGEPTYRVSELGDELRLVLGEVFPLLWVQGEVHRPRASQRGHLYFELVEKGRGDQVVGRVDAVIWRTDHQRVRRLLDQSGQRIEDGLEIRCLGQLDFYPAGGRLQLVVREVDPSFALGELERRRRQTLAALEAAQLIDRNRGLDLADVPLRLGLVTSADSAAYHDFVTSLRASGYGFRVLFAHADVQGARAERSVASALAFLGRVTPPLDVIVLTRGGGSRTDLAAFDSRLVAEAVARAPVPVICGLGHEIDRSIADAVCHTAVKTPTAAAELLVARVESADGRVREAQRAVVQAADRALDAASRQLRRAEGIAQAARLALAGAGQQVAEVERTLGRLARARLRDAARTVDEAVRRLPSLGRRAVDRDRRRHHDLGRRLADLATAQLRRHDAVVDGMERLCHGLAPERLLERGFSITRRADDGSLVTAPDQVRSGDGLRTLTAGGAVHSMVAGTIAPSPDHAAPDPTETNEES